MDFGTGSHSVSASGNQADYQGNGLETVASLPKGGGAIRAISDGLQNNPATDTASLSVPLPASPARALTPQHALSYDSGAGNNTFGLSWQIAVPKIARRMSRGLPLYDDGLDVFTLGGQDLVTATDETGKPVVLIEQIDGNFLRLEHWRPIGGGTSHWRSWTADNIVSIYGQTEGARIADPLDSARIAEWAVRCLGQCCELYIRSKTVPI